MPKLKILYKNGVEDPISSFDANSSVLGVGFSSGALMGFFVGEQTRDSTLHPCFKKCGGVTFMTESLEASKAVMVLKDSIRTIIGDRGVVEFRLSTLEFVKQTDFDVRSHKMDWCFNSFSFLEKDSAVVATIQHKIGLKLDFATGKQEVLALPLPAFSHPTCLNGDILVSIERPKEGLCTVKLIKLSTSVLVGRMGLDDESVWGFDLLRDSEGEMRYLVGVSGMKTLCLWEIPSLAGSSKPAVRQKLECADNIVSFRCRHGPGEMLVVCITASGEIWTLNGVDGAREKLYDPLTDHLTLHFDLGLPYNILLGGNGEIFFNDDKALYWLSNLILVERSISPIPEEREDEVTVEIPPP